MGPAECAAVTTAPQSSSWWVLSNAALPTTTTTCVVHPKRSAALCTHECSLSLQYEMVGICPYPVLPQLRITGDFIREGSSNHIGCVVHQ